MKNTMLATTMVFAKLARTVRLALVTVVSVITTGRATAASAEYAPKTVAIEMLESKNGFAIRDVGS
jgi:hypothetical protein